MSNDANVLVHYIGNADPNNATGALTLDGRPDLLAGQAGYVTADELVKLAAAGYSVIPVTEDDLAELGVELPEAAEEAASAPAPVAPVVTASGSGSGPGTSSAGSSSSSGSAS